MNVDLEKLAALSAAATKGPWSSGYLYAVLRYGDKHDLFDWTDAADQINEHPVSARDALFIAAMRNSIDALVAECLAAREWLKADDVRRSTPPYDLSDEIILGAYDTREAYRKLVAGEGT